MLARIHGQASISHMAVSRGWLVLAKVTHVTGPPDSHWWADQLMGFLEGAEATRLPEIYTGSLSPLLHSDVQSLSHSQLRLKSGDMGPISW